MRTTTLLVLALIGLIACDKPAPPAQLTQQAPPAAPPSAPPLPPAPERTIQPAQQADAAPPNAGSNIPPGMHIALLPDEASEVRWELRDEAGAPVALPDEVRDGLTNALFPVIAGPKGDLLLYDVADAITVYDMSARAAARPIPLEAGVELLGYGANTAADRVFTVVREKSGDTMLYVAPRAADAAPIAMKIRPHTPCGSICAAPSVHFFDDATIRYRAATPDGEPGAEITLKLP